MKQLKIIVLLASVALMMNASFAGATRVSSLPGWLIWGPTDGEKYEIGLDAAEGVDGHPALYLASKAEQSGEVAAITQTIDGSDWQGQVIEFSLMARAVGAQKNKIWIRHVNTPSQLNGVMQLSGNQASIPDSKGWEKITLKTYFPKTADPYHKQFEIGVALASPGKIWIRDLQLMKATPKAAPDDFPLPTYRSGLRLDPPRNLNFSE